MLDISSSVDRALAETETDLGPVDLRVGPASPPAAETVRTMCAISRGGRTS